MCAKSNMHRVSRFFRESIKKSEKNPTPQERERRDLRSACLLYGLVLDWYVLLTLEVTYTYGAKTEHA